MLRADIDGACCERRHAQRQTDELQLDEWLSWYTLENTEPCGSLPDAPPTVLARGGGRRQTRGRRSR